MHTIPCLHVNFERQTRTLNANAAFLNVFVLGSYASGGVVEHVPMYCLI